MVQTYLTATYLVVFQRQKDISADDLNMNERENMTDNKQVYPNCWDLKSCFNYDNSCTMCGKFFCKWHGTYLLFCLVYFTNCCVIVEAPCVFE